MVHRHRVSPRKDLNLVLYVCKTKATGKHLCCGFPEYRVFPLLQSAVVCVRVLLSIWVLVESQFSLWGPSGSVKTGGIYVVFPLCRHLLLRGTLY